MNGEAAQTAKPQSNDRFEVVPVNCAVRLYACGHQGPLSFQFRVYGALTVKISQFAHCPECMIALYKPLIIRCACCGLPIYPGEGVALAAAVSGIRTEIGTKVDDRYIVCLREKCAPPATFSGNWTGKEYKRCDFEKLFG